MDWNQILSLRPSAIDDNEKDVLLNMIAWFDIETEDVDLEKCSALLRISQEIMKFKSEQVEALVEELDELAKKEAEDELKGKEHDLDARSQRSRKSSSLDYDELEEKYRATKNKLKQQNKVNEKLRQETNKLNNHIKMLEQDRDHLQNELQSLQKDEVQSDVSEGVKDQHQQLVEAVRQKNKQLSQLLNDVEVAETENSRLKDRLSAVRDKLAEATGEINKMTDEFLAFKVQIDEKSAAIEDLLKQNEGLRSHIEDISQDKIELKKQLEDFAVEIDRRVNGFGAILDEKNSEIAALRSKIASQSERADSPETNGPNLAEVAALNKIIIERDDQVYELRKQLQKATEEMKETTRVLNRVVGEKQMNEEQLNEAKQLNKELKDKLKMGFVRSQSLQEEVGYLQELLAKKDEDIKEILSNLKKEGGVEIGDFLGKYQHLKSLKRSKEKKIIELVKDVNKLQEGFDRFEKENLELRSRLGLSEDENVPITVFLTKQKKQKALLQDLQVKITKLEEEKLNLRLEIQRQFKIINNLTKQLNEIDVIPIINLQDSPVEENTSTEEIISKDQHKVVVEENEALRKGLQEILDSLQNRKEKGYRDINSETLENLLKALDSKHIAGWYHAGMRLQAEIHSLQGCNKELRDQLKMARAELTNYKKGVDEDPKSLNFEPAITNENKNTVESLNVHISKILNEHKKEKDRNEILVGKLEKYKADFESVQEQLRLLYEEYNEAKVAWNNEKIQLNFSAQEITEKVEVLEAKLEEIRKLNLTDDEQVKVKQISEMAGQVVVLNRKCLRLEDENIKLLKDLNSAGKDLLDAEVAVLKKMNTVNEEKEFLMNRVEVVELQLKNKVGLNLYTKLLNDFDNLTIKHRKLLSDFSKIKTDRNDELEATRRRNEILKEEKDTLMNKIQDLMAKINSYEVSSFEIDSAVEVLTKKLSQSEVNEISQKQRANHMCNLYELVKEQLKNSEERFHEFEKYNKEIMERNLKLQESIKEEQNKVLNDEKINADEYDFLKKRHEVLLKENVETKKELADLKLRFETAEKLNDNQKQWTSAQEYELISLKHQVLDLQATTDDKAVISRLSSDVIHARLMEAESTRKFENLQNEYKKIEIEFENYKIEGRERIEFMNVSVENLQQKIRDLQSIVIQQRQQYLGYIPLISETRYIENVREIYRDKHESYLNFQRGENARNEIEITKEQLREQLSIVQGIKNVDLQEKISKWYNEKSLIQLQELKHRRKSEFVQTQLDQALEKIKLQDQHMCNLEEALFLAYQQSEVEIPKNFEDIKLKSIESETATEINQNPTTIKVYKSEETQTIYQSAENDENSKKLEHLQFEILENQNLLKAKEENLEQLKSKITELEMNLSLFKSQLGDKQSQIMFYEKHILELQSKKDVLLEESEEFAAQKAAVAKLQAILLEKEEETLKYQSLLKRDRDEHSLAAQRMQEELRRLQQAYKELKESQSEENPGKLAIEQYIKQVHGLEKHTDELHTTLTSLESQLKASREECVRWRSLANERLESMDKLRNDLEEMHKNELSLYKDDCEKWRQEVLSLKTFVSKFQGSTSEKSADLQKLIKDKDNRIHELTVHLRQLRIAARKKPESTEVSPHLQDVENEKEQLLKELETAKKKCEGLLNKERNYREEIRTLKNQLMKRPTTSARSDKSDNVKDQLYKKVSSLEKENAELKENLQQQLLTNEAHRTKVAEDFEKWNKQKFFQQTAEKLRTRLKEKSEEFEKLRQTCSGYRLLVERLEREKHALEGKNKNLRASSGVPVKLEMLEIENAKLQAELEATNAKYEMAQHHSGGLGATLLQEKLEAQERKIAILELAGKGTSELRNEIERLQTAVSNLHKANLRLEAENLEFKLDLEKSSKETPHLKEQIQYLENYVDVLKAENSSKVDEGDSKNVARSEPKKVSELERTVFVLKRIVEKLQAENKRLQGTGRVCNEKVSDDVLRRDFYKLKDQYGDAVQKVARLEEELSASNSKLRQLKTHSTSEVEELKATLEQKGELLEKVKILLHRAAIKEKALLEEISRLKSLAPCSSTSLSSA